MVILAAKGSGRLMGRIGQPPVLGEILAGILLGPSLLGAVWPSATGFLFPPEVVAGLGVIAQLGLVLFMFLVGVEVDLGHLRGQGRRAAVISQVSIIVPFGLGIALSVWLQPRLAPDAEPVGFALFMGAAMAITAFPVLARVLQQTGLDRTRLGALALTCAAIDDVTAWCILAGTVAVVEASGPGEWVLTVVMAVAFVVVMLGIVRPALRRFDRIGLPLAVALALGSAWVTEVIGIHAIFGAFLFGMVLPRDPENRRQLTDRLESATTVVLLPVFFVVAGLSTTIGSLDTAWLWMVTAVIVLVAVVGKLGGATLAARAMGESWSDALGLGILMNTRGLTEIVILTVGLELGVISRTLYTMMVIMALVTTFMAAPLLSLAGMTRPAGTADERAPEDRAGPP